MHYPDLADASARHAAQRRGYGRLPFPSASPPRAHTVKRRERLSGTIVGIRRDGRCIVDLGNGCVGSLRSHAVGEQDRRRQLQIGEQVQVEVVRTWGEFYAGPRSVALELVGGLEARWARTETTYPLASIVDGTAVRRGEGGYLITVALGVTGWLPDREVSWSRLDPQAHDQVASGQVLRLMVIDHVPRRRQMLLSLRRAHEHPLDQVDASALIGTTFSGVVTMLIHYGAFVRLPIGVDGLLHRTQFPEGLPPALGDQIAVTVMSVDAPSRGIALCCVAGG